MKTGSPEITAGLIQCGYVGTYPHRFIGEMTPKLWSEIFDHCAAASCSDPSTSLRGSIKTSPADRIARSGENIVRPRGESAREAHHFVAGAIRRSSSKKFITNVTWP
jgi:hypothetical protein